MVCIAGRIHRLAAVALAGGSLICASAATAKLPHPRTTLIVPGTSIGAMKLGMTT